MRSLRYRNVSEAFLFSSSCYNPCLAKLRLVYMGDFEDREAALASQSFPNTDIGDGPFLVDLTLRFCAKSREVRMLE